MGILFLSMGTICTGMGIICMDIQAARKWAWGAHGLL